MIWLQRKWMMFPLEGLVPAFKYIWHKPQSDLDLMDLNKVNVLYPTTIWKLSVIWCLNFVHPYIHPYIHPFPLIAVSWYLIYLILIHLHIKGFSLIPICSPRPLSVQLNVFIHCCDFHVFPCFSPFLYREDGGVSIISFSFVKTFLLQHVDNTALHGSFSFSVTKGHGISLWMKVFESMEWKCEQMELSLKIFFLADEANQICWDFNKQHEMSSNSRLLISFWDEFESRSNITSISIHFHVNLKQVLVIIERHYLCFSSMLAEPFYLSAIWPCHCQSH